MFRPTDIELAGTRNAITVKLVQEIGRHITVITQQPREMFLFQRLFIALQQRSLSKPQWQTSEFAIAAIIRSLSIFMPVALCWWSNKSLSSSYDNLQCRVNVKWWESLAGHRAPFSTRSCTVTVCNEVWTRYYAWRIGLTQPCVLLRGCCHASLVYFVGVWRGVPGCKCCWEAAVMPCTSTSWFLYLPRPWQWSYTDLCRFCFYFLSSEMLCECVFVS